MSIQTQITLIFNEVTEQSSLLDSAISAIQNKASGGGTGLPELTNPGTASDLVEGKQLIGADGKTVTGTVNEITPGHAFYGSKASSSVDVSNDLMLMAYSMDSDNLLRNGTTVLLSTTASELGDAETGDVAEGVTFTSKNGKKLTGTHTCSGTVLPDLGEDAGSESDLAKGKKLIGADGTVVTGTLNEITSDQTFYKSAVVSSVDASNDLMFMMYSMDSDNLLREDTAIILTEPASNLGDAETGDVVAGKTFTSANGKKLTGTHTCSGSSDPVVQPLTVTPTENTQTFNPSGFDGYAPVTVNPIPSSYVQPGGTKTITENGTFDVTSFASVLVSVVSSGSLPNCITAMTSGSFSVGEDTENISITHSLGVAPDFLIWWTDEDFSATAPEANCTIGGFNFRKSVAGEDYSVHGMTLRYSLTNGASPSVQSTSASNVLGSDAFRLYVFDYPIKAGYTYHYIVGALNNNP